MPELHDESEARTEVLRASSGVGERAGGEEQASRIGLEPAQKPGRSKQDYSTPPVFVEACVKRFGFIKADLAATYANRVTSDFYGNDGHGGSLVQSWAEDHPEGVLWLNPPFGDIEPWAEKCAAESRGRRGLILLLTPASVGSNWFAKHVLGKAVVLGLSPRLSFVGTTAPYPKDLMLSVYGYGLSGFDQWRWDAENGGVSE